MKDVLYWIDQLYAKVHDLGDPHDRVVANNLRSNIRAALTREWGVTEGWKLVPIEPDASMVNAAVRCIQVAEGKMNRSVLMYVISAAIAAAPEPGETEKE